MRLGSWRHRNPYPGAISSDRRIGGIDGDAGAELHACSFARGRRRTLRAAARARAAVRRGRGVGYPHRDVAPSTHVAFPARATYASGDLIGVCYGSKGDGVGDAIEVGQLGFSLTLCQKSSGGGRWGTADIEQEADGIIESSVWTQ
jgi:hypothetical protein